MTKFKAMQMRALPYLVLTQALWLSSIPLGSCATAEAKPATKAEALQACKNGCTERANEAFGETQAKVFCTEMCTCLVNARFDETGKQKKSTAEVFQQQMVDCNAHGRSKAGLPPQ